MKLRRNPMNHSRKILVLCDVCVWNGNIQLSKVWNDTSCRIYTTMETNIIKKISWQAVVFILYENLSIYENINCKCILKY